MHIPLKYQWLLQETAPRHMLKALELYGVKEIVGKIHSPIIMGWAKEVGLDGIYKADETPWCGLAMAVIMKRAGREYPMKSWDVLRALEWRHFGVPVKISEARYGDVLIFGRTGGGHVGLYTGEDNACYHTLGGNQGNMFNIIRMNRDRIKYVCRPPYHTPPLNIRKILLSASGVISKNEA